VEETLGLALEAFILAFGALIGCVGVGSKIGIATGYVLGS
jgi:hypothetical protein